MRAKGWVGAGDRVWEDRGAWFGRTLSNASTPFLTSRVAGSAKFGVLANATFAVRVQPPAAAGREHSSAPPPAVTRALRTAPPPFASSGGGVSALAYGGTYPLSRLRVLEPALAPLTVSLFAYSKFVPGDPAASAPPAVVFSLAVSNSAAVAVPVSALFVLPFGAINDCMRSEAGNGTVSVPAASAAECLHACAAAATTGSPCASWNFHRASGSCVLLLGVPLVAAAGG